MYLLKGVGLAAPQAGINERLVVINAEGGRGKGQTQHELALVNPKVKLFFAHYTTVKVILLTLLTLKQKEKYLDSSLA